MSELPGCFATWACINLYGRGALLRMRSFSTSMQYYSKRCRKGVAFIVTKNRTMTSGDVGVCCKIIIVVLHCCVSCVKRVAANFEQLLGHCGEVFQYFKIELRTLNTNKSSFNQFSKFWQKRKTTTNSDG